MTRCISAFAALLLCLGTARADTLTSIFVVPGEACPPGGRALTYDEAAAAWQDACRVLGAWYIARLAGGGSMDGPGYRCAVRRSDARNLGHVLCRREAPGVPVSGIADDPSA